MSVVKEVGAAGAGAADHLLEAPAGDGVVVARQEFGGDFEAFPVAGAGVVRAVEQAGVLGDAEFGEPLGAEFGVDG